MNGDTMEVMALAAASSGITAYAGGTTYAAGATVTYGGTFYISLQAGNTGHAPSTFSA